MKKNKKLIPFTKNACSISDDWTYKDMKVVWLENDYLKIVDVTTMLFKQESMLLILK